MHSVTRQQPHVSVVIPSYNSSAFIERCLTSVSQQKTTRPYEVIVVDSSDDDTSRVIAKRFPLVNLIRLKERTFPGAARNRGIEEAAAPIIAFTDSDCIVDDHWLDCALQAHDRGHDVVGGSIENARAGNLISDAEYFLEFREFSSQSLAREVRFVPSCNMSIRRAILDKIGTFPATRASEDVLFSYNLAKGGVKMFFAPSMRVAHLNRTRLAPFLKNQWLLGINFSVVRRLAPIRGWWLVRYPPLLFVAPFVRIVTTLRFILSNRFPHNFRQLGGFVLSLPLFLAGLAAWTAGALKGSGAPKPN